MRITLGSWTPDLASLAVGQKGLVTCQNARPKAVGYEDQNSLSSMSLGSTTVYCRGAISGISSDGVPFTIAGDETKLYLVDPGTTAHVDKSKDGGYALGGSHKWRFEQFDDDIIAVTPNHPIQVFNLSSPSTFEDLSASAPRAACIGVVKLHTVVGNTVDLQDGKVTTRVWWPANSNPYSWPTPGSDTALAVLSDYRDLKGAAGDVQNIVGGTEVGAIFQEKAISRMDFRGGQVMYQIDQVEKDHGLLIPDLVVPFGRQIFFLAESGFRLFDYTGSVPIGEGVLDKTFLADLDRDHAHRVSACKDPDNQLIYVSYPGSGNTAGLPNKILLWHTTRKDFALCEIDTELVFQAVAMVDASIDQADAEDVDSATGSFDDRLAAYGAGQLGAYSSSHVLSQFAGTPLKALWETGDIEFTPGFRSMTGLMRPLVDQGDVRIQIGGRSTLRKAVTYKPAQRMSERTGACPSRMDSRYHRIRMTVDGGFDDALGVDTESRPTGKK